MMFAYLGNTDNLAGEHGSIIDTRKKAQLFVSERKRRG